MSENQADYGSHLLLALRPVVVTQESTKTLSTLKAPALRRGWFCVNECVGQTLVIPLAVIVRYKLPKGSTKVTVPQGEEKGNVREGELHTDRGRSIFGDGHLPLSVDPVMGHFYEAARQVIRLVVAFVGERRQTSSERAQPLNQPGDLRANGFASCLIVKPMTSRGPHTFIRALYGTTACRRTRRSEGGVAHSTGRLSNCGHMSSSR
jgi:hypothetical protein